MKPYDIEEQNTKRLQIIKEEINHLSASIDGLIKKVQTLEKNSQQQTEINESFKEAIELIAEELEIAEERAES